MRRSRLLAIPVLLCLLTPAFGQDQRSAESPTGAGGFPVTFTHASAWFIQQASSNQKDLALLVYFQGAPGWHDQITRFNWELKASPASIQMSVGETPIRVLYWPESSSVEILGNKFSLLSANVFVVEGIDSSTPLVRPLGVHTLAFSPSDNPALVLLQRSPGLRAALTGSQEISRPASWRNGIPRDVLALDEEGLGMLGSSDAKDQKRACELFRRAAEHDFAASQYRLGYCYESGSGVEQDFSVANEWYEKAAMQGYVDAQYKLGHSYRVGRGTEIDLPVALRWFTLAAENGDKEAQHNVGWMYATGQGTEPRPKEAFNWFLRAAQNGEEGSQFEVARRLKDGDGVGKDLVASFAWLLVLEAQKKDFDPKSWESVQGLLKMVERELDDSQRSSAKRLSQEWLVMLAKTYIAKLALP